MNETAATAILTTVLVSLLLTVALYVWTALALQAVFVKTGQEGWKAWVPVYNGVVLLQLGRLSGWWMLLLVVPGASIVVYVMMIVACHRINAGFGYSAAMTVLAALLFPVWASVVGWSSNRWVGVGRGHGPVRTGMTVPEPDVPAAAPPPARVPGGGPDPFAPAPAVRSGSGPDAAARLSGGPVSPVPGARPAAAAADPAPRYPVGLSPDSAEHFDPGDLDDLSEGVRRRAVAPAADPVAPPRSASPGAETSSAGADDAPLGRRRGSFASLITPAPAPPAPAPTVPAAAPVVDAGAPVLPAPARAVSAAAPAEPAAAAVVDAAAPAVRAAAAGSESSSAGDPGLPRPVRAAPVEEPALDAPHPVRGTFGGEAAPAVPSVAARPGPVAAPGPEAGDSPWAPPSATRPPLRQAGPSDFSDTSGEVSAIAGAPVAGGPMSARSSVSAQRRAPEVPDAQDAFDETIIAVRKRTPWMLVPPLGAPIAVTADVLILGRRPSLDPTFPGAQLIAVNDETRTISKTHARLEEHDGSWVITDLDSTNGVLLIDADGSGIEVDPGRPMPIVDRFLLGDAELRLIRDTA